jgi:hypothetical protein
MLGVATRLCNPLSKREVDVMGFVDVSYLTAVSRTGR